MTYEIAFKRLKEKFANVDAAKLDEMAIQITMTDEDCGGTFYAKAADGKIDVQPYDYRDNDAVVNATRDALSKILDGKLTIEKAVEKGVLTVKGDLAKVEALQAAVKAPEKKAPAKKAEVKAEPAKKAEVKAEPAKKAEVKAEPAKKAEIKAEPAKKAPAKKTEVKAEAPAKKAEVKAEPAKKAPAKKAPAKKAPAAKKTTK